MQIIFRITIENIKSTELYISDYQPVQVYKVIILNIVFDIDWIMNRFDEIQ